MICIRILLLILPASAFLSCGEVQERVEYSQEVIAEAEAASQNIQKYIKGAIAPKSNDIEFRNDLIKAVHAVASRNPDLKDREFLRAMINSDELYRAAKKKIEKEHPLLAENPKLLRGMLNTAVIDLSRFVMDPEVNVAVYVLAVNMVLNGTLTTIEAEENSVGEFILIKDEKQKSEV